LDHPVHKDNSWFDKVYSKSKFTAR